MTVETRVDEPRGQFPVGMRVLAVDDDPTCLLVLETPSEMPISWFASNAFDALFFYSYSCALFFSRFCDSVRVSEKIKKMKKESISLYLHY
ncbi:hypothetical protein K1719_032081 [Acacia pycnantha]|nr:hypothetical protein K1719_032081 [Acacia pycnantha]